MRAADERGATVSVVVLSYNRPALLREALASVAAQTHAPHEVIVVDNPSGASGEVARVVAEFGRAALVRNATNEGYAGGMNRGVERAAGEYVFLTEDDIVLERDCLRRLLSYAEEDPSAGLTGPLIYNKTAGTIRCAGGEFELGGIYRRKNYGEGEEDRGQYAEPFEVKCLDGAALLARTHFLREAGGFREEFFMYGEAIELAARVGKAGRRLVVVPGAKVYHFEPPARANTSAPFEFHRYKNLFAFYLLHAPARRLPEFFCRYALVALARACVGRGGNFRALLGALTWTARRAPSLLRERRRGGSRVRAETRPAQDDRQTAEPRPGLTP